MTQTRQLTHAHGSGASVRDRADNHGPQQKSSRFHAPERWLELASSQGRLNTQKAPKVSACQRPSKANDDLEAKYLPSRAGKVQQALRNQLQNPICGCHVPGKLFGVLVTERGLLTKHRQDLVTCRHWVIRKRLLFTATCLLFLFMAVPFSFQRSVCFCQMESKSPL